MGGYGFEEKEIKARLQKERKDTIDDVKVSSGGRGEVRRIAKPSLRWVRGRMEPQRSPNNKI